VGYLPQDFSMYPNLSVYEAMDYLAILSGIKNSILRKKRIIELLEVVNLENQYKTKVKALSGGMKRRLGIAQALIHNPSVLIVDEPTAGLDPEERIRFRNLLNDFAQNRIVILSTHIVEDVEFTCENLAVMREGNIIFQGKVKEMLKMAEGDVWTVILDRESLERLRRVYKIVSTVSEGEMIKSRILSKTMPIESAERIQPSIEDAYLRLMGEGI
jgi:ABC-2 type transport system ATP-binding protein